MDNIENIKKEISNLSKIQSIKGEYELTYPVTSKVASVLHDLDVNHNTSWAIEIFKRNRIHLDNTALFYRGRKISYREMFNRAYDYSKTLKELGFNKGDEIPVCIGNIPEFVYLMLAASFIGCRINSIPEWIPEDYAIKILNLSNSKYMFVDDMAYFDIKDIIDKSNISNVIAISLTDSLFKDKAGNPVDPYEEFDKKKYEFKNKVLDIKFDSNKDVISQYEFLDIGKNYVGNVLEDVSLDEHFTTTYTSGTTGNPKAIKQPNRSYVTLSRFRSSDVSNLPIPKKMRVMHHVPTYTHMNLSAISDSLYQGWVAALEPIYDEEFFIDALIINDPNYVSGSVGFHVNFCKKLNNDPRYKNFDFKNIMLAIFTGEEASPGEEKYCNYTARKHKFGVARLPYPLAPVKYSIGGGTSEGSGSLVTLYKAFFEKLLNKKDLGLMPMGCAKYVILDREGNYCKIGEPGLLGEKSPCDMIGYDYVENSDDAFITASDGKKWLDLGCYSYISDKHGRVKMKGRPFNDIELVDGSVIPLFKIEQTIQSDTKNILSCSLIDTFDESIGKCYVAHIEFSPLSKNSQEKNLESVIGRLKSVYSTELLDKIFIRIRSNEESFPLTPSGKRNLTLLRSEGIKGAISVADYIYKHPNKNNKVLSKNK